MNRTFAVALTPEPDGGFTIRIPALPEIVSWAATKAEVESLARDAIELVLQDRLDRGEPIPSSDATLTEVTVHMAA